MEYIIGVSLLFLIYVFFKFATVKGFIGNWLVKKMIGKNRPKRNTFVIQNLRFYDGAKSFMIKHVLVNCSGIHIIETKHARGTITGNEIDKVWTQHFSFSQEKKYFANPITELIESQKALKQMIDSHIHIHVYIVFIGSVHLKVSQESVQSVHPYQMIKIINQSLKRCEPLKPMEVRKLYEQLKHLKHPLLRNPNAFDLNNRRKYAKKGQAYRRERSK